MNWFACVLLALTFDEAPVVLKPAPETPQIHLPVVPVLVEPDVIDDEPEPPKPRPDRTPKPVTTISEEQLYVIESTIPLIVLSSPDGFVKIEAEEGPQKVKAKFVDGTGKMETRVFNLKHLYFINAVKPGKLELIIVPIGVEKPENILRQELTVLGQMPNPPPEPDVDPIPDPVDPPAPVASFRVIFVKESGITLNTQQSSIPAAKVIRDYLVAKTTPENGQPGWREYDPDQSTTTEQPTMASLWASVKPSITKVPCLVIEVNGHATVMPFPANVDECMATLKKAGG